MWVVKMNVADVVHDAIADRADWDYPGAELLLKLLVMMAATRSGH
jgi:hypothetical protein